MSLPYFPMYPSDFEAKTSHLTIAEDGAYNRLLRICWMTPGCTMPADEAWIMRRARAHNDAEKEAVRAVLAEFFKVAGGRYSNARLTREFIAATEAHEKRKNAGSKGGKAKSLKSKGASPSNAVAKPKQPEPEPEPYRDTNVSLPHTPKDPAPISDAAQAVDAYNAAADDAGWPKVQKVTKSRLSAINGRLKDSGGLNGWAVALGKARASPFLCGENDRGWRADFDWITKQGNFIKIMEGKYDRPDRSSARQPNTHAESNAVDDARRILVARRFGGQGGQG